MNKIKKMPLHLKVIISLVLGCVWAVIAAYAGWSEFTINWINPFGIIFINLLKLIAVPLVLFSIIGGISNLSDLNDFKTMGIRTLAIYIVTTIVAISIGLIYANLIQPGDKLDDETLLRNRIKYEIWAKDNNKVIKDGKCFSCLEENQALLVELKMTNDELSIDDIQQKVATASKIKSGGPLRPLVDMVPQNIISSLSNTSQMLQIIVFAILFGLGMKFAPPEKVVRVKEFVNGVTEVFLEITNLIMRYSPFFIFCLLAGFTSQMVGDSPKKLIDIFKGLSIYSITIVLGLITMTFFVYPVVLRLGKVKLSYKQFFRGISAAQALGFSSSSSAATLPITFDCVENNLGVSNRVSSFVLPLGATINMDGTSLYQAIAAIFVAQIHMIHLDITQQITIILIAVLSSIGTAPVPSAGIIMLIMVLESVGLNPAWVAIIMPVDRILDMCRTATNITGDSSVACVVAQSQNEIHPTTKH